MYFHHGCEARGKAWSGLSGDIGQWVEGLFFSLSVRILAFSVFLFFATQAHGDEAERAFTGWVQKGHTRCICNGVVHVRLVGLGHSYFMFSGLFVMRKLRRAACGGPDNMIPASPRYVVCMGYAHNISGRHMARGISHRQTYSQGHSLFYLHSTSQCSLFFSSHTRVLGMLC
jgi:hypothetical protein